MRLFNGLVKHGIILYFYFLLNQGMVLLNVDNSMNFLENLNSLSAIIYFQLG